jgi:hypothetical protein
MNNILGLDKNKDIPGLIMGRVLPNFPYPDKECPYCYQKLKVVNAIHWEEDMYQYKALYLDPNPNCPVYDEGARKAYARIVYSTEQAYAEFNAISIPVQRWSQEDLYSYYK